ncbi:DUF3087 domain-containing protein [Metapseudomonas resinovorans]|uniref:DUF3087 domain-containing protein n=1 Tax=Metapseudomonas resinovorans NBRC 106553 TaxID=1245471 RepID=S6BKT6_METRE|nr:DUF3087 domain-containing protein [Pseudomonas resinovorans]BAN49889.1 hypothetical protein PCA10_41570 [Pseudomonas resinovorans NBRC 106553]
MSALFEIRPMDPELYRRQTRRITLIVAGLFIAMAMLFSTLSVQLFGSPGGDNFRWNLIGVLAGLAITVAVVRLQFWPRPWMAPAVYGWQLKRSLMRIGNVMHKVKAGVAAGDPTAMKLLRFYHLALTQMHQLDGNSADHSQMVREIDQHREAMEAQGLEPEQKRLEAAWLEAMKAQGA